MALTQWSNRRVLVTGATGFIGCRLAHRLADVGTRLWVAVYPGDPHELIDALPGPANQIALSLENVDAVRDAVAEAAPDVVFHLAAVGVTQPAINAATALQINTLGTVHLLEAVLRAGIERVVLTGTCHEYGAREDMEGLDPVNFYAASKVASWAFARAYWRAHELPTVTVRPFQVYGPAQPAGTLVPSAIGAALAGEDLAMTPGEQQRDFIFVDDVVDGMMAAALATGIEGQSIDLGTGTAHPIRRVVGEIWRLSGASGRILAGALPYRASETMRLVADADRTAALTGWRAHTGLEDGLRQTIHEFRARTEIQDTSARR